MSLLKNKFFTFWSILIIFLTSFLLGMYVSGYSSQDSLSSPLAGNFWKTSENTQNTTAFLQMFDFFSQKSQKPIEIQKNSEDLDLRLLMQVYKEVQEMYYDFDEVDKKELEYAMISGLVSGLGDKHSEFMKPEEQEEFMDSLNGDFEGIGAVITEHELGIEIDRIIKGSPALEYGLLKGDIVIEADGQPLQGMKTHEAVKIIRWPADSEIELKILRTGENEIITKKIVRKKIRVPSVEYTTFEEKEHANIANISLNTFGNDTTTEFNQALKTAWEDTKVQGIIIDLRDNGGGYLDSVSAILGNFIERNKTVVVVKFKWEPDTSFVSKNRGGIFEKKIVVLVNENSASASEIMAGALQDYHKAILVGKKTYGKGSVQQTVPFRDGSMLKITNGKWFTPNHNAIDGEGITPDIEISFEKEDIENRYDRQLAEAKKILQTYLEFGNIALTIDDYQKKNPPQSQDPKEE